MKFRVKRGGSVIVGTGRTRKVIKPGELIPDGMLPPESIPSLLKSGHICRVAESAESPDHVPGLDQSTILGSDGEVKLRSKWDLDPEGLTGMDLDQLNVLVAERDSKVEPFETAEEARDWLSQDFGA